jgi:hypothetical protein
MIKLIHHFLIYLIHLKVIIWREMQINEDENIFNQKE